MLFKSYQLNISDQRNSRIPSAYARKLTLFSHQAKTDRGRSNRHRLRDAQTYLHTNWLAESSFELRNLHTIFGVECPIARHHAYFHLMPLKTGATLRNICAYLPHCRREPSSFCHSPAARGLESSGRRPSILDIGHLWPIGPGSLHGAESVRTRIKCASHP